MQARRLKTREQFQAVLACPPFARTEHFVMHRLVMDTACAQPGLVEAFPADGPWLGAMVPKRWARRAVTRNLIKRQIYNVAAQQATVLPAAAYLVRMRGDFSRARFKSAASDPLRTAVRAEIEQLFRKVSRPPADEARA